MTKHIRPFSILFSLLLFVSCSTPKKEADTPIDVPLVTEQRSSENELILQCKGSGLDDYRARLDAIEQCQKSFSAYTESEVDVQQIAFSKDSSKTNLSLIRVKTKNSTKKCEILSEKVTLVNSLIELQLTCKFDLRDNHDQLAAPAPVEHLENRKAASTYQTARIITYPKCDSIIIVGIETRTFSCISGSTVIEIFPGDNNILVEKTNYSPVSFSPAEINDGQKIIRFQQY